MKKLLLHFDMSKPHEADCLLWGEGNRPERMALSAIADKANNMSVIVFIPTEEVLLAEVNMPKMGHKRLRKALPFAMEDWLISDVSHVHLVSSTVDKRVSVGVIDHDKIKAILNILHESGVFPEVLVPDVLALPFQAGNWSLFIHQEKALLRVGQNMGYSVDLENLNYLLTAQSELPERLDVFLSKGQLPKNLNIPAKVVDRSIDFLTLAAKHLSDEITMNFLQTPYAVKRKWGRMQKRWLPAGILLGIWLLLFLLKSLTLYFYLNYKNQVLDRQILALYQREFPGAKKVDLQNAREQFRIQLDRMRHVAAGHVFLDALSKAAIFLNKPGVILNQLTYEENQIELAVEVENSDKLNATLQAMRKAGLVVQEKSTHKRKGRLSSQWVIKL